MKWQADELHTHWCLTIEESDLLYKKPLMAVWVLLCCSNIFKMKAISPSIAVKSLKRFWAIWPIKLLML